MNYEITTTAAGLEPQSTQGTAAAEAPRHA
jgi:hypothetical protein